jgi:hypothetical protein
MGEFAGLATEHVRALDRLIRLPELGGYYLAGRTAVAHHLGHRRSLDMDFFSLSPGEDLAITKAAVLAAIDDVFVVRETDASLHVVCGGTPVDFVRYPHPPLEPPGTGPQGVRVAGLLDLAAMKLLAIARRDLRRDFWDLFAISQSGISIARACDAYAHRFGIAEADLYHVLRALTYFADAEADPVLPRGLAPEQWTTMRAFFQHAAVNVLQGTH